MRITKQQHIVIAGSGNLTIAAYKTLVKEWRSEIKNNQVCITIITSNTDYECPELLGEMIAGRLERHTISCTLSSIAKEATIIHGQITSIDRKSRSLELKRANGNKHTIFYHHLVLEKYHSVGSFGPDLPCFAQRVSSCSEAKQLCLRLNSIIASAARSRNLLSARNFLRFAVFVQNESDLSLATYIDKYVADRCNRYYALKDVRPEINLVELSKDQSFRIKSSIAGFAEKIFSGTGIRWIKDGMLHRFAEDGIVLNNGRFIACSLMIYFNKPGYPNAANINNNGIFDFANDEFLRLKSENNIWIGNDVDSSMIAGFLGKKEGTHIAKNIVHSCECRSLLKYVSANSLYSGLLFSDKAILSIPGIRIKNRLAWYLHILYLLLNLPTASMSKNSFINLAGHYIWHKTKIQSPYIHQPYIPQQSIRAAS